MKKKTTELVCIVCPNGCELYAKSDANGRVVTVEGAMCARGKEYAKQECFDPHRNIATSVIVEGGELPLASVRLTNPIPKRCIFEVMDAIHACRLSAPVQVGQVVLSNVLGLDTNVIVTRAVEKSLQ